LIGGLLVRRLLIRRLRLILAARLTVVGTSVAWIRRCGGRNAITRNPHGVEGFVIDLPGNSESVADLVTANRRRSLLPSLAIDLTVIKALIF
jgi:hypothetical protein